MAAIFLVTYIQNQDNTFKNILATIYYSETHQKTILTDSSIINKPVKRTANQKVPTKSPILGAKHGSPMLLMKMACPIKHKRSKTMGLKKNTHHRI